MRIISLLLFVVLNLNYINLLSQIDTNTVYKNLEVRKFYSVGTSSSTTGGRTTYKINNRSVKKAIYDKYNDTWENMATCCPCILKSYNENDILLTEAVSCTDCGVGYYKEFYPNGQLKLKGQFRENSTNNWKDIYGRGYCSIQDGMWLYFNDKGQINYIEIWDDGNFIEQRPKSNKIEIWKVDLSINGISVDTQKIAVNEFHKLEVIPKYKNSNKSSELKLKIRASANGFKRIEKEMKIEEFDKIKIEDLIEKVGTTQIEKIDIEIGVYEKNKNIWNFYIDLKE